MTSTVKAVLDYIGAERANISDKKDEIEVTQWVMKIMDSQIALKLAALSWDLRKT